MPTFSLLNQQTNSTLTWNLFIKSHVDSGLHSKALFFYKTMRQLGFKNDSFTFPIINKAVLLYLNCDLVVGEMIHCDALKLGFGFDLYFCNTMIDVYAKFGFSSFARKLFDEMFYRDLVSFTTMIDGYVFDGNVAAAFELSNEMRMVEIEPNSVTLIVMLQGCSSPEHLNEGRELHGFVIKTGVLVDRSVQNSILKIYTNMGCVEDVESIFDEIDGRDVVSWNTLIGFYFLSGDIEQVAIRFNQMCSKVALSSETLTLVTTVFAKVGNLVEGEKLHCISIKIGLCDDILLTSLLDFYGKCGELRKSAQLFEEISYKSSITWKAMMSSFIQNGCFGEAIQFFQQMRAAGLETGAQIIGSVVDSCAHLGALQLGKVIHGFLIRNHLCISEENDVHLWTSILNMYIRCGNISLARQCFDRMLIKDIVTWTSMIEGYGIHGLGIEALNLFHRMLSEGITPNSATFLSLLSGCSHSGLVSEGCKVFFSMKWMYGIEPDLDHYTCVVDLLGRSGKLEEALTIIIKMVNSVDSRIWGALLASSRVHGDRKIGKFAAQRLLDLESDNVGYHTLLSNIEADIEHWAEVEGVRRVMHEKDLKKTPGWSYIEGKEGNSCFVYGDRSHKRSQEIYEVVGNLSRNVQEFGFL